VTGHDVVTAATPGEHLAFLVSRLDEGQESESDRGARLRLTKKAWWASGALTNEIIRREFMRITRKIGLPDVTTPKTLRHMFATCLQDTNVDPLIRMELMGHAPQGARAGGALGMTSTYTHTRPETRRGQLLAALERRPCTEVARGRSQNEEAVSRAG
jgi:integrase